MGPIQRIPIGEASSRLLVPIANNKYDAAYAQYFTGFPWKVIPSYCGYTGAQYSGKRDRFLYSSNFKLQPPIPRTIDLRALSSNPVRRILKRLHLLRQGGHTWQDIADYQGVVHIPYNVSIMSIFEQYAANIPLFFPTIESMKYLYQQHREDGVLSQISFNQVLGIASGSCLTPGVGDPNAYDEIDNIMEWVKLADFYDKSEMAGLCYFSSFEELNDMLSEVDLLQISARMQASNAARRARILRLWREAIDRLSQV